MSEVKVCRVCSVALTSENYPPYFAESHGNICRLCHNERTREYMKKYQRTDKCKEYIKKYKSLPKLRSICDCFDQDRPITLTELIEKAKCGRGYAKTMLKEYAKCGVVQ